MSDRAVVAVAVAVVIAAAAARPVPWWAVAVVGMVALGWRRPVAVGAALVLLTSALAAGAVAGLEPPPSRSVTVGAGVLSDPDGVPGGVGLVLRTAEGRFEARATGVAASALRSVQAGQRVEVDARIAPLAGRWEWRAANHLRGSLAITAVRSVDGGPPPWRIANRVRAWLVDGAGTLAPDQQALFDGVLLGDDRAQSPVVQEQFRGSGLSHLLAVSGQNVAFVLVASRPVLSRLGLRWRWAVTVVVLVVFAMVTRFEPSVLRAVTMAGVAATASMSGRRVSGGRVVALSVIALVVIDPMLVWSTGFRLSAAATVALVALSRPLGRVIPGPPWLSEPLAVSLAAQVGTAPLLLPLAGVLPVSGLLVNLAAVPVAGWLMVWGMTACPLAGMVGGPAAAAVAVPTRLMLAWIVGAARVGSDLRLPVLDAAQAATVAVAAGAAAAGVGLVARRRGAVRSGAAVIAVSMVAVAAAVGVRWVEVAGGRSPAAEVGVRGGALVVGPGGESVAVIGGLTDLEGLMRGIRRHRLDHVDLVVVTSRSRAASSTLGDLVALAVVRSIGVPSGTAIPGSIVLEPGTVAVGSVRVGIRAGPSGLRVGPIGGLRPGADAGSR